MFSFFLLECQESGCRDQLLRRERVKRGQRLDGKRGKRRNWNATRQLGKSSSDVDERRRRRRLVLDHGVRELGTEVCKRELVSALIRTAELGWESAVETGKGKKEARSVRKWERMGGHPAQQIFRLARTPWNPPGQRTTGRMVRMRLACDTNRYLSRRTQLHNKLPNVHVFASFGSSFRSRTGARSVLQGSEGMEGVG